MELSFVGWEDLWLLESWLFCGDDGSRRVMITEWCGEKSIAMEMVIVQRWHCSEERCLLLLLLRV
jgi:hypothetical protein